MSPTLLARLLEIEHTETAGMRALHAATNRAWPQYAEPWDRRSYYSAVEILAQRVRAARAIPAPDGRTMAEHERRAFLATFDCAGGRCYGASAD